MAYNPRMSMAPPNSQQKNRGRKKEEDDAFLRLPDSEIAGCISDIGVPFTAADLQKPNPGQIQQIFQFFAELLMNATHETIAPAMRAAAEDVCGEYMDIVPSDVRNLMGFYIALRKLLIECGVADFSFQDLQKPTHERLSKIFSYIINFVRFRESQTALIDDHFNRADNTKVKIETLYMENQDMEARLQEMKRNQKAMEGHIAEKVKRNQELKQRLRDLQASQKDVATRHNNLQQKKGELVKVLEDKTASILLLRQESAKLRPYVLQSPAALQTSLTDLGNTLSADKANIDTLDRRARALQTSSDTFTVVSADIGSCNKLLDEIAVELSKEEEENVKNAKQRDALSERGVNVREVEREENLLQHQLAKYMERTEKLREGGREKDLAAKRKMEELRAVHKKLTEERSEKGKDMERRRVRIEQIEKKMADLKENIENEIHNAHDEFLKMDSHIKLYITEMEQSI